MDVPVEVNRALKPVIEADDRVMRKHKQFVSSVMRNFHLQIVLYALKAIAEGIIFLELFVVIADNQMLFTAKLFQYFNRLLGLEPAHVAEDITLVIIIQCAVPFFNQRFVMRFDIRKRTLVVFEHIRVTEMRVGYKE